jgi:hypothetical protein
MCRCRRREVRRMLTLLFGERLVFSNAEEMTSL